MANVLPPENQKEMRARMRARFISTFALIAGIGACILYVSILPSYITLAVDGARLQNPGAAATSSNTEIAARDTKVVIAQLQPILGATTTPAAVIATALSARPQGVHITRVAYSAGKIEIAGTASVSSALEAFRNALSRNPYFTSVTVPVSALVGSHEGAFTMTLSGAF